MCVGLCKTSRDFFCTFRYLWENTFDQPAWNNKQPFKYLSLKGRSSAAQYSLRPDWLSAAGDSYRASPPRIGLSGSLLPFDWEKGWGWFNPQSGGKKTCACRIIVYVSMKLSLYDILFLCVCFCIDVHPAFFPCCHWPADLERHWHCVRATAEVRGPVSGLSPGGPSLSGACTSALWRLASVQRNAQVRLNYIWTQSFTHHYQSLATNMIHIHTLLCRAVLYNWIVHFSLIRASVLVFPPVFPLMW